MCIKEKFKKMNNEKSLLTADVNEDAGIEIKYNPSTYKIEVTGWADYMPIHSVKSYGVIKFLSEIGLTKADLENYLRNWR
jgi:hypothetical protein